MVEHGTPGTSAVRPTFQKNVMATNDLTQVSQKSSIIALAVTFLAAMAVGRGTDPIVAYFMFLIGALFAASLHPKWREITDHPAFKIRNAFRPIVQSLIIGAPAMAILIFGFGWSVSGGEAGAKVSALFTFAVVGAFVEEIIRWVWLQTLPIALIVGNGLWVLIHPSVARMFNGQTPDLLFAGVAFLFGLMMTVVMWLYESPVLGQLGYGPMAAVTFHALYNGIAITFVMKVAGVTFNPFSALGVVALTALAVGAAWVFLKVARRKGFCLPTFKGAPHGA